MGDTKQRNRTPTLSEVIGTAIENRLLDLHTTFPGKIDKWDPVTQKADIKPLLKRPLVDEDGNDIPAEALPVIPELPVQFDRADFKGGKFFVSFPLKRGDLVTVHVTEAALDQWLSKPAGEDVDPVQFRRFNLSDAYFKPGCYPFGDALVDVHPDNLVIGKDGGGMQLHITAADVSEFRKGGIADVSVAIAEALKTFWDTTVKPKFDASDAHTHLHSPGPGAPVPTGPPVPVVALPTMPTTVVSDNVKLKDN